MNPTDLPPNPYWRSFRIYRWVMICAAGLAAISVAMWFITAGGKPHGNAARGWELGFMISSIMLCIIVPVLPLGYFIYRAEVRKIDGLIEDVRAGNYLVWWRYGAGQWEAYHRAEHQFARRRGWSTLGYFGAGTAIALAMLCWQMMKEKKQVGTMVLVCGVTLGVFVAMVGLIFWGAERGRRQRMADPRSRQSVLATRGIFANGSWIIWGTAGRRLSGIDVVAGEAGGPNVLRLTFQVNHVEQEINVLIPEGQLELAGIVAEKIRNGPVAGKGNWLEILSDLRLLVR